MSERGTCGEGGHKWPPPSVYEVLGIWNGGETALVKVHCQCWPCEAVKFVSGPHAAYIAGSGQAHWRSIEDVQDVQGLLG